MSAIRNGATGFYALWFLVVGGFICAGDVADAAVWYVDQSNGGPQDGTSWTTAFTEIQPALDAGAPGDEVWVAAGVYSEVRVSVDADGSGVDTGSLVVRANVDLFGGFAGTETNRADRDWETNVTVIDGSLSRGGNAAHHVVVIAADAIIDGFTITGGDAMSSSSPPGPQTQLGGGIYCSGASPVIRNCAVVYNAAAVGGGFYFDGIGTPTIDNCRFEQNEGTYNGGGAAFLGNHADSHPAIVDSHFFGNQSPAGGALTLGHNMALTVERSSFGENAATGPGGQGGVLFVHNTGAATLTNCIFYANAAVANGGVYYSTPSGPSVVGFMNCTFSTNVAAEGHAIYGSSSTVATLTNCIVWDNTNASGAVVSVFGGDQPAITYSNVQGGFAGTGNLNPALDPQFVNAAAADYYLQPGSPCVDAGTSAGAPNHDIEETARPQGAGVDMGAYEIVANSLPEAHAGADVTVECTGHGGTTVWLDGSGSTDADSTPGTNDDIVLFEWLVDGDVVASGEVVSMLFDLGVHAVTLRVTDSQGATDEDSMTVTVQDTTPPVLALDASPHVLWPANHKLVDVHVTATVTDACDAAPSIVLVQIINSESDDSAGGGDGNTDDDVQEATLGADDYDMKLRAERRGKGDGRVYTLVYRATDASGNSAEAQAVVEVPHDTAEHACDQLDCDLNAQ